jgi:(p)ppGpp synthase/HD superfamily hydrolase
MVCAALLHDVLEDTGMTADQLQRKINNQAVVNLVVELTNVWRSRSRVTRMMPELPPPCETKHHHQKDIDEQPADDELIPG